MTYTPAVWSQLKFLVLLLPQTCIRTGCRESTLFPSLACCRWERKSRTVLRLTLWNVLMTQVFYAGVLPDAPARFWNRLPQKEPTLSRKTVLPVNKTLSLFYIFWNDRLRIPFWISRLCVLWLWPAAAVSLTPRRHWTRCLTRWLLSRTTVGLKQFCGSQVIDLCHVWVIHVLSLDAFLQSRGRESWMFTTGRCAWTKPAGPLQTARLRSCATE